MQKTVLKIPFIISRLLFIFMLIGIVHLAYADCDSAISSSSRVQITDLSNLMANAYGNSLKNRLARAKVLGWINLSSSKSFCGGYFADPYIPESNEIPPAISSTPVTITADSGNLQYQGISTLRGKVLLTQPGRIVSADEADIVMDEGVPQRLDMKGQVLMREKGKVAVAKSGGWDLELGVYHLQNVIYRLFLPNDFSGLTQTAIVKQKDKKSKLYALSAWGKADRIFQPLSQITQLQGVSYSTCSPQNMSWSLQADNIELDREKGRGYAYNAVLSSHGIPFFYLPYFNFPIDSRRQTGVLFPFLSTSGDSGFGIGLPFYWNIAPNQDDTFTPYLYTKRGVQLDNQYRYLTSTSHGDFNISLLPNDWGFRKFQQTEPLLVPANTPGVNDLKNASSTRYYFSWQHLTQFSPSWAASINYTRASDDYYIQDFEGAYSPVKNQLLRQGQIRFTGEDIDFLGNLQSYQTLHPINEAFVENQYSMLPQLLLKSNYPVKRNTLNYGWLIEYANFLKTPNPGQEEIAPSGQRVHFVPTISLPLSNAAGYITPSLQFDFAQYSLRDQPVDSSTTLSRAIPIFSINSGLFLEKDIHFNQNNYLETLEPRLFYLYVPFRDQHDIPVFDSSMQPFTYEQLFRKNRFTGADRIGDANQVGFALESHFMNLESGEQKISTGIGMTYYFTSRKVTLCSTLGCFDSPYAVGSVSPVENISPIVGYATYLINSQWKASLNAAWDVHSAQMQNNEVNLQYNPLPNHIINIGYRFIRFGDFYTLPSNISQNRMYKLMPDDKNNLSQPEVSFAWPLNEHWQIVGSWQYSLNKRHAQTYFYGMEYDSCCWAAQVVYARSFNSLNLQGEPQFSTGIYVQFALRGLGKLAANDPTMLLLSHIPGYQDNFINT